MDETVVCDAVVVHVASGRGRCIFWRAGGSSVFASIVWAMFVFQQILIRDVRCVVALMIFSVG